MYYSIYKSVYVLFVVSGHTDGITRLWCMDYEYTELTGEGNICVCLIRFILRLGESIDINIIHYPDIILNVLVK